MYMLLILLYSKRNVTGGFEGNPNCIKKIKRMYLRRGFGARLGARHEDAEQPHDDQVNFIDGTALILLGNVLQRNNMD